MRSQSLEWAGGINRPTPYTLSRWGPPPPGCVDPPSPRYDPNERERWVLGAPPLESAPPPLNEYPYILKRSDSYVSDVCIWGMCLGQFSYKMRQTILYN